MRSRSLLASPLALVTAVLLGHAGAASPRFAAQRAPESGPADGWRGTIHVTRHGSTAEQLSGGTHVSSRATEEITYTLRGDGSASYTATHDELMTLSREGISRDVHMTGHGSGDVVAGVAFLDPDPIAMRLLGIRRQWDLVAGDGTMQLLWDVPNDDIFGGALLPFGISGHMEDETEEQSFHGAEVLASAPPDANTLHGTDSSQAVYSYFWPTPMTQTVTYSLTRSPVDPTPRVTIHGPACGCLDADDPERTPLRFIATSSRAGGEFSEFTVTADGEMPDVRDNEGGASARLELVGSKQTGAVTLRVTYEKDGRRYEATPFRVEFCTVEPIELRDSEHDLSFDLDSTLTVDAKGKAWHDGREVSDSLDWEIERMGTPTTLRSNPDAAKGEHIQFVYEGLPEQNADFGPKKLTARVARGACRCQRRERIRAFFPDVGDDHPGAVRSPNWYYYWKQTKAAGAAGSMLRCQSIIGASTRGR